MLVLLNASKSGSVFLFGPLAASPGESGSIGFILVFQVLPVVIFFAAFTSMLYHLRVLQIFVRLFARLFHRTMKISGAESLSSAANIFVGIESALVVRPYLEKMTRSELLLVLTTGMATVASSTLGVYVAFLIWSVSTNSRTPDLSFGAGDSCLRCRIQAAYARKPKRRKRSRPFLGKTSRPARKI